MIRLLVRMTHLSWIVTSLLLSLLVGLTIGCSKLAVTNGNWMTRMGDVRNEDGYWGKRSQGQRLAQIADLSNSRRVRNRRNQGASTEPDYDSAPDSSYSDSSSVQEFMDENAINTELSVGMDPALAVLWEERRRHEEHAFFNSMDLSADGRVTNHELATHYYDLKPSLVRLMFESTDENGDGFVTFAEFMREPSDGNMVPTIRLYEERRRQEAHAFNNMDLNADGRVTKHELASRNGLKDVEMLLQAYDGDGDGIMTFAEFMRVRSIFVPDPVYETPVEQPEIPKPEIKTHRECTQQLMEVCDAQFINSTKSAREDSSHKNICSIFQVYIDCLARESTRCRAEEFTGQALAIASGLRDEGACPDLQLTSVLYPDLVNLDMTGNQEPHRSPGRAHPRPKERPQRPTLVDITAAEPSLSMYGSGGKQEEDYRYGQIEVLDGLMLADVATDSSSSSVFVEDTKVVKSNHERKNTHHTDRDSTRTRDRTGSRDNVNMYEVTTPLVKELPHQLPQYDNTDVREHSKSDNVQTATSSWKSTTQKHHHRHHHTSSQTQSTEHLQALHIRQARSSTTKKSHVQRSRSKSRSNCSVATIWPCNQAFVMALAEGQENPCESLVRFRHCVHKSTRHCIDTNVFKIREGLKYLSKEHRRAKLCRQITL